MHGCTITTSHYLAHTRVLAESFLARHPGAEFSALVIDDSPRGHDGGEPFQTLVPADIGIDPLELNRRATMYLTQGLAVSMKPNLLLELLSRADGPVLFLDADSCVYADLEHVADLAERHSLVLSPHSLDPYPLWQVDGPEQIFIRAGVMNAGFLGVGEGAQAFLRWWAERTARRCIFDPERGLFLEQTWLMLAPALFEHHVLRDRGCNVAGWNLHTRDVRWDGEIPTIDDGPLRHFHFAMSYDPENPQRLTASEHARWWPTLEQRPGVARLSREYAQRLLDHDYREVRTAPPLFDKMPQGAPIEPWMRASYHAALLDSEYDNSEEPPNPFTHGAQTFTRWLEPRAVDGVKRQAGAGSTQAPRDAPTQPDDPFGAQELALAMMDTEKLLRRIRELDDTRDDIVRWAERELEQARQAIAQRDAQIDKCDTLVRERDAELERKLEQLEEIWSSPSWRVTEPLRSVKALLARRRAQS